MKRVLLEVNPGVVAAEAWVRDATSRIVERGITPLRVEVPPGLYKIGWRTAAGWQEQWREVDDAGQVISPDSAAPPMTDELAFTPGAVEVRHLRSADFGADGSELVIQLSARSEAPHTGLRLRSADGELLANFFVSCKRDGNSQRKICRFGLPSGSYLLQYEVVRGSPSPHRPHPVEQTIVTCAGWTTLVFASVATLDDAQASTISIDQVHMSRIGDEVRWEQLAPSARLLKYLATGDGSVCKKSEPMAWWKRGDAMCGLIEAHALLRDGAANRGLLQDMADALRELLSSHPDLVALDLHLNCHLTPPPKYSIPPMLASSWDILVRHSTVDRYLVPPGSYAVRVAEHIQGGGPWLSWKLPVTCEQALRPDGTDALRWLRKKGHMIPRLRERLDRGILTQAEARLLNHIGSVVQAEAPTRRFAATVRVLGALPAWLNPIGDLLLHTVTPFLSRTETRRQTLERLSDKELTSALGMPICTLERVASGVVRKLPGVRA